MKHDYTEEEIKTAWKDSPGLRAFLDALPERPQAQPVPWPGQQEAIDAAFEQQELFCLDGSSLCDDWKDEASDRLAIAQAYDKARPQAAEIAELKADLLNAKNAVEDLMKQRDKAQAELARWRSELSAVMPSDFKDWYQNNPAEWPAVAAQVIRNLRAREDSALEDVGRIQAELAALREPALRQSTQSDAGISLGQVAFEAGNTVQKIKFPEQELETWEENAELHDMLEAAARAVASVVLAQAVRRMEAVPVEEIKRLYYYDVSDEEIEKAKSILISAAKGDGQAQETLWAWVPSRKAMEAINRLAKDKDLSADQVMRQALRVYQAQHIEQQAEPVVVNEPPQGEKQPDLPLKSEKQTQPALTAIDDDGNPVPVSDEPSEPYHAEEVPEVEATKILGQHGPKGAPALRGPSAKPEPEEPSWIPHDGGPCPLRDEEVEEWEWQLRRGVIMNSNKLQSLDPKPSEREWSHGKTGDDIIAYRVLKWKPSQAQQTEAQPWTPAPAQQAEAQPWTPAVGDTVRLKSGGPVMTVVDSGADDGLWPVCWFYEGIERNEVFPTACLIPAPAP